MAETALQPAEEEIFAPAASPAPAETKLSGIARARAELEAQLASYTPKVDPRTQPRDRINDRYSIRCDQPLPEFSRGIVKAYAVVDSGGNVQPYYAAVCDNGLPYRHTSMEKLLQADHPNLLKLEARAITHVTAANEQRYVLMFRRPAGHILSQVLKDGNTYNEQQLTEQVLSPIVAVMTSMEELGISHCHIHPDNIYVGEQTLLGECISQPAGYSQEFLYEPIERVSAMPQGKGGGTIKVDSYALGMLVVDVLHGLTKLRTLSKEQLTGMFLTHGSYNVVTGNGQFSEHYHDLLRGTLTDDPNDRWGPHQLNQWLTGKRFNIIHPSAPRESSRPFPFEGQDYFNRKALAHALFTQWDKARNFLRTSKLDRWLEQSIQLPEASNLLQSAVSNTGGAQNKNQKRNNELVSRTLCIIDPSGPLRSEHLAFNVDAMGKMLCDTLYHKRQAELNIIIDLIQNDLPHFWSERQGGKVSREVQEALWKLQNIRPSLGNPNFGFGIERCLYDLNQDLPCYSQELKGFYITDLPALLPLLDAFASSKSKEFSLLDRHLIGFISAKTGINREIRFQDISAYAPALANNAELKVIAIVGKAQAKADARDVKGLSLYVGLRILNLLENVHSRKIRDSLAAKVQKAAEQGSINGILNVLLDGAMLERDLAGFQQAYEMYHRNAHEVGRLRDRELQKKKFRDKGKRLASLISIVALLIMGCIVIMRHFPVRL